jgi:type II secretory pathway pseudopilin PulG
MYLMREMRRSETKEPAMRGFTVTELIVVAAIMALTAILGLRYYFTNTEIYRFQNALTEFKSALNLARARSMSGVVSLGNVMGDTSSAMFVTKAAYTGSTTLSLTTASNHKLTAGSVPYYVTLNGFAPKDPSAFADPNYFPWCINGLQCRVTGIDSPNGFTIDVGLPVPTYLNSDLKATAAAFLNYVVWIRPVDAIEGKYFARAFESGPIMDFQYNQNELQVAFKTSDKDSAETGTGTIIFDKGLIAGGKTYTVSLSLKRLGSAAPKTTFSVLTAGAVR